MFCGKDVMVGQERNHKNQLEKYEISKLNDETILLFQERLNDFCDIMDKALSDLNENE